MSDKHNLRLAMVIGIYIAIAILLFSIIILVKNIKEIKSDPILYGIDKNDYYYCNCYSPEGIQFKYELDNTLSKNSSVSFNRDDTRRG